MMTFGKQINTKTHRYFFYQNSIQKSPYDKLTLPGTYVKKWGCTFSSRVQGKKSLYDKFTRSGKTVKKNRGALFIANLMPEKMGVHFF